MNCHGENDHGMNGYVLEMTNISKSFPGVKALTEVSISVKKGEVLALLGENGAGKSTLIKVLSGVYRMDSGEIRIEGWEVDFHSPLDAQRAGIGVIYQELCLEVDMTVAENLYLGREEKKGVVLNRKKMREGTRAILNSLNLPYDPDTTVRSLTIAQRQMIEIARAVSFDAKIIIMDEPTSSLSKHEVDILFKLIQRLKERDIAIIYISHRMDEIFCVADKVTVLRDGKTVGTSPISQTNAKDLIDRMVGRSLTDFYIKENHVQDEVVLRVDNLVTTYSPHPVSFSLRRGEILGFSGLIGAGRSELMRVLFGVDAKVSGEIWVNGQKANIRNARDALECGLALVPENRKEQGLVLVNTVGYNLTMLALKEFIGWRGTNRAKEDEIAKRQIQELNIKTYGSQQIVNQLSGGNQQKIVLGKWLTVSPRIFIMDEPTRGIDVGAKAEVYEIMNALTARGVSIVMVSSELPEVVNMSDRVAVMADGRIVRMLEREEISQTAIMQYALHYEEQIRDA